MRRVFGVRELSIFSGVTGGETSLTLTPKRFLRLWSGTRQPGCSVVAEITSSPSRQSIEATPRFMPWVVFWVRATSSGPTPMSRAAASRAREAYSA